METGRSRGGRKQTELLTELNAAAKGTHYSVRKSSVDDRAEGTLGHENIIHAQLVANAENQRTRFWQEFQHYWNLL